MYLNVDNSRRHVSTNVPRRFCRLWVCLGETRNPLNY